MKNSLLSLVLIFFMIGCSKTDTTPATPSPVVNFTYAGAGVAAPCVVTFNNTTSNATSYLWDFGDNATSTLINPTHTYTSGGVFTVKLTANGAGGSSSTSKTVNILPAYTKVTITKITLYSMPANKSNGTTWDPFDGPDVYLTITDSLDIVKWDGSGAIANNLTSSMFPVAYSCNYWTTNFYATRYIDLWDYDTFGSNEYINWVSFIPSKYISLPNPYPANVTLTENQITIKLDLLWQ